MNTPKVSIILPVFNGEKFLEESINSILKQSYDNFELIIVNDGSVDASQKIIESFGDPRIRVLHQSNMGLPAALNNGIELSIGEYIARQDADDISLPLRLEKQVNFLDQNSQCGLVGSAAEIWVEKSPSGRFHDHPLCPGILEFELIFNNPFVHSSWMFRRKIISQVGIYTTDVSRQPPEDYEYISRISRCYQLANLKDRLIVYREVENSLSSQIRPENLKKHNPFSQRLAIISAENLAYTSNVTQGELEIQNFGFLIHDCEDQIKSLPNFKLIEYYLTKAVNQLSLKYPGVFFMSSLSQKLVNIYFKVCQLRYDAKVNKFPLLKPLFYFEYRAATFIYSRSIRVKNFSRFFLFS
jgi:glycosyltransferase involved in cell wall biosynthesis